MAEVLNIAFVMPDGRTVEAAGFAEQFERRFSAISDYLSSKQFFADSSDEIFSVLEKGMGKRFEAEGAALGGNPWLANSPEWAAFKLITTGKSIIGEFTGAMIDSFTERNDTNAVRRVEDNALVFGSSIDYAATFDEVRPLLIFDNTVRNDILRAFQRQAVKKSKEELGDK